MWSKIIILIFAVLIASSINAQECDIKLSGYIYDAGTKEPLEFANVFIEEELSGSSSDDLGYFEVENVCAGHLHISFSHIGCESKMLHIDIESDTSIIFYLDHTDHVLHQVSISDKKSLTNTQFSETINKQYISDNAGDNLSDMVSVMPGVSSLKNGSSIAKPVVQGLYGNRLTILNNGVVQAGQQWGSDHSPEIDPLIADKISVIKGVNAITYLNGQLGAIVLVEPGKIDKDPHLHGKAQYFYESNGRSHGINAQLRKYSPNISWKLNATLKRSGDNRSPDYFLRNTGTQEVNLALQLEKDYSDNHSAQLYISTFNSELGVLRGSQIGNLTDLEQAIGRDVPFFTEEEFSYDISAPQQQVNHHLIKYSSQLFIDDHKWLKFNISGQYNVRKEFDVRRGGLSETPALSLDQTMGIIDLQYNHEYSESTFLKSGFQGSVINNTNNPETGILPLVPDYIAYNGGLYTTITKKTESLTVEAGLRYDLVTQDVAAISTSLLREIIRYDDVYHNISTSVGTIFQISEDLNLSLNTGYALRSPAINERFSFGLHQGVSGIEEGTIDLNSEASWKSSISLSNNAKSKLYVESIFYFHNINDYIYLQPQAEFQLTIRGAFPVFKYEQTDARIVGLDLYAKYEISPNIETAVTYSYINGTDRIQNNGLVFIPANNLTSQISYALVKPVMVFQKSIENLKFSIDNRFVFRKTGIDEDQDFLITPDAYNLISLDLSGDIQLKSTRLRLSLGIDNVANVKYRDYLNRLRYFSDDLGRNIKAGMSIRF
jgi:iron complex outermembrane receptor protein